MNRIQAHGEGEPARARRVAAVVFGLDLMVGAAMLFATRHEGVTNQESDGQWMVTAAMRCGDRAAVDAAGGLQWPWIGPWLIGQGMHAVPDARLAGRLVSVIAMAAFTTTAFFLTARLSRSTRAGLCAALIIAFTPETLDSGTMASNDLLATLFLGLAMVPALSVVRGESRLAWAAVAGLCAAAATMTRYQMLIPAPALGLVLGLVAAPGSRLRAWGWFFVAFVGAHAAATALPWVEAANLGGLRQTFSTFAHTAAAPDPQGSLGHYLYSAETMAWTVGYLPLVALAVVLWRGLGDVRPRASAAIVIVPTVLSFLVVGWLPSPPSVFGRHFLPWILPTTVALVTVASPWWRAPGRRAAAAALSLAFAAFVVNQDLARFPPRGWPTFTAVGLVPSMRPIDLQLTEPAPDSHMKERASIQALRQAWDPGCDTVVTDSDEVAFRVPRPALWRPSTPGALLGPDGVGEFVKPPTGHAVRWVVARRSPSSPELVDGAPVGDEGAVLRERQGSSDLRVFEVDWSAASK